MLTAKQHYDDHLAHFYSWMAGDLAAQQKAFTGFLEKHSIRHSSTKVAIDLGAGHGIQSIPLALAGFKVTAIDFSTQLLDELLINAGGLPINRINGDIRNIRKFNVLKPELIVCCGDTISHLRNKNEVRQFVIDCAQTLAPGGRLLFSFRDYSKALTGNDRIIPVKSDEHRKLTCILDFEEEHVLVTDELEEKHANGWQKKVSSYKKVRITTPEVVKWINDSGLRIAVNEVIRGMVYLVGELPK